MQREQAQQWVDDLIDRSRRATEDVFDFVRSEVTKQLDALGLDPEQLAHQAAEILRRSAEAGRRTPREPWASAKAAATKAAATTTSAKKAAAKKAGAGTKATATKATAKKATAKKATATKTAAKKAATRTKAAATKAAKKAATTPPAEHSSGGS